MIKVNLLKHEMWVMSECILLSVSFELLLKVCNLYNNLSPEILFLDQIFRIFYFSFGII